MPDSFGRHKATIRTTLDFLRYHGAWIMKVAGGLGQRPGVPDILFCLCGRFGAVEVKTGRGALTLNQRKEREWIERAGGIYILAATVDDVESALVEADLVVPSLLNVKAQ